MLKKYAFGMKGSIKHKIDKQHAKEIILYLIFGVGTTVVNILIYRLLLTVVDYRISNLIALVGARLFAYITNKLFVFKSKCNSFKELLLEFARFLIARGATGLLDYFGLIAAVELFHLDRIWSKYVLQAIVIVLNYILSKKAVFNSPPKPNSTGE